MKNIPYRVIAFAVFCLVMVGSAWWMARQLEMLPDRLWARGRAELQKEAERIRDQFLATRGFQPRIRVQQKVVFEQTAPIAELAVLTRTIRVEREWVHSWAGSTKKLILRGEFRVKCGFDLQKDFEVILTPGSTVVRLPEARILSVETVRMESETEDGWWNAVNDTDRGRALAGLQEAARRQGADLPREASRVLQKQLEQALGGGVRVISGNTVEPGALRAVDGAESGVR